MEFMEKIKYMQPLYVNMLCNEGIQLVFRFDNDWGASVVQHRFSYGGQEGHWELAVIKFYDKSVVDWDINYEHPESHGDVRGHLSWLEVLAVLENIKRTDC